MKKKKTRAFIMTPETAQEFYRLVKYLTDKGQKDTPELRMFILTQLANAGKMNTVFDTGRSHDQVVEDFKKRGYNVDDRRNKHVPRWNERHTIRGFVGGLFRALAKVVKATFMGGPK